jgi:hypothetical protein
MARKKNKPQTDQAAELLRDLLIVELAKAGVTQPGIRTIVGCDMHRVSRIARHFKKVKRQAPE